MGQTRQTKRQWSALNSGCFQPCDAPKLGWGEGRGRERKALVAGKESKLTRNRDP